MVRPACPTPTPRPCSAVGRDEEAREWFARAADADDELETDAADRLAELDGVVLTDLLDGEEDDDDDTA